MDIFFFIGLIITAGIMSLVAWISRKKQIPIISKMQVSIRMVFIIFCGVFFMCCILITNAYSHKNKYDKALAQLRKEQPSPYTVAQFTPEIQEKYTAIKTTWKELYNDLNSSYTVGLKRINLEPSIKNLVFLLSYEIPEYNWFSSEANEKALAISLLYAELLPVSHDQTIYISGDSIAMIFMSPQVTMIFEQTPEGIREYLYRDIYYNGIPRAEKPAFKGMELYSWEGPDRVFRYALLSGTNRIKPKNEILNAEISLLELKSKISKLAKGEHIFWQHISPDSDIVKSPHFVLFDDIKEDCDRHGITLISK